MVRNLRHELNAYCNTNACRLATILLELCAQQETNFVSRDDVAARWAELYPRHATQTGKNAIRHRMVSGLSLLKAAGLAVGDGADIVIRHGEFLWISARNLSIVQDAEGVARRPALWPRPLDVPDYLAPIASELEESRQATIAQNQEGA